MPQKFDLMSPMGLSKWSAFVESIKVAKLELKVIGLLFRARRRWIVKFVLFFF